MNAFLAVLGTFWFRTQQRRAELGLRVALGSTRVSLRKLLLGEGLILLTLAFIPAIIVGANLGFAEIVSDYPVEFTLLRFLAGMFVTYILLDTHCLPGRQWVSNRRKLCMKIEN